MFEYSSTSRGDDDGFAIVTDRFVCLLSPDATAETARAVFWLLDGDDAQLEDALGRLAQVEDVERFAIVEMVDAVARSMRVAVRGQISVGMEGTTATRMSGPGEAPWITGEARGVSSLWLSLDEREPGRDGLPIRRGVVRTRSVVADPSPEPLFSSVPRSLEVAAGSARPGESQRPANTAIARDGVSALNTIRVDLNELMSDEGDRRWSLRLPDGHELEAESTIVIGRKPGTDDVEPLVKHVAAPSPKRQISGVHLELALVEGNLVARDLDSTNGTIVLTPQRPPRLLHGGRTTALQTGDILDLGESFRIVVSNHR